jgi:hypothetical protein
MILAMGLLQLFDFSIFNVEIGFNLCLIGMIVRECSIDLRQR